MLSTPENFRLCSFVTSEISQMSKSRIARNAIKRTEDLNQRRAIEMTDNEIVTILAYREAEDAK